MLRSVSRSYCGSARIETKDFLLVSGNHHGKGKSFVCVTVVILNLETPKAQATIFDPTLARFAPCCKAIKITTCFSTNLSNLSLHRPLESL